MLGDYFTQLREALGLTDIQHTLAAIVRQLNHIQGIEQAEETIMSEVDDKLAALQASLTDLAADLDRELADLQTALSGKLTTDEEAAFQAVSDKVAALKSAIDTADPQPPVPAA